jgi:cyanophycinase
MPRRVLFALVLAALCHAQPASVGPRSGSLVIVGGGSVGPAIVNRFLELAGGRNAPIVVIPTADTREQYDDAWLQRLFLVRAGATDVTVLHTRERAVADSGSFNQPLEKARGVWFGGGRQWRLVDSYLNTRTHRELWKVLERGGVIGGSSAGATIQGSYLVRGAREGNQIMMAPGYEVGLGFLRNTAIDQHLLKRNRQEDLVAVVAKHPSLLGIGIDESTAIVVEGDRFEVIGESKVAIYEHGRKYYFLNPGDRFDLGKRTASRAASNSSQD